MESQEKAQGLLALKALKAGSHGMPGCIPLQSRKVQHLHIPSMSGYKMQASLSWEQHVILQGGKPGRGRKGRTHPSKEYLLVFGMSMMSMKPLFPERGRDRS